MERVELRVFGISYSQIQEGAYALILSQVNGPYRIPIVIGVAEAQSIAIRMENVNPSRPMSHDLFVNLSKAFGIVLEEVFIYKFEDGVFYSELTFSNDEREVTIDSRTSDAIAIALRTGARIFTTPEIVKTTGIIIDDEVADREEENQDNDSSRKLENLTISELENMMQKYADAENYEGAAKIKEFIANKRSKKGNIN